ncbi:MAG: hypothetical protein E4H19_01785 [Chromatiales bacterium]|jgi:uncharacterized protein (DUF4415 family)|nr:MAG: hypothetical protein E4H19_01785 [Chromatiales bacterium]
MKSASSRSAKRPSAKRRSSSTKSQTDWNRIRALKDEDIVVDDEHPEAELRQVIKAVVRVRLKPLPPKSSISLRVDQDVLDWFKAQGPGYQTRINLVLRAYRDAVAKR